MRNIFRKVAPLTLAAAMAFSTITGATGNRIVYAEETQGTQQTSLVSQVKQELMDTSKYLMEMKEATLTAENPTITYNDYIQTMIAMKSGEKNETVVGILNAHLQESLEQYDTAAFLNPLGSNGVKSYTLAIAILYLEEQGEDVTNYAGRNLYTTLKEVFEAEVEVSITPYAYQYIYTAFAHAGESYEAQKSKIEEKVLSMYVEGETGTGIDAWGWSVSVDDSAQILPVFAEKYQKDAEIKRKADAALAWNKNQANEEGAIVSWGSANTNSTALAMKMAAQFGNMEDAQFYYQGLTQFRMENGAYTYAGRENLMATADAQLSLLAYVSALEGKRLFDVTRVEEPETQEPETQAPETQEPESQEPETQEQETLQPETQKPETQEPETQAPTAPETGDAADVMPYLLVMSAISLAAVASKKWDRA